MNNKRIIIILMIFTVIFTLMGGTFAYFNWQSADNRKTNVTFTVNRNYTCGADAGGHITSSDVTLVPAKCNDPVYAIKRPITTSVTTTGDKVVSMDLWLNINSIDTNLTNTANFKWVIGKNRNNCTGVINQGDFRNIQNGKIMLLDDVEYATLDDTYYLYIWLDEAETNPNTMNQSFDFSISGECVDSGLEKALLKSLNTTDYFREADYKTKITDISFIYDDDLPSGIITNNVKTYDLGANASKPIVGYLIENTDVGADLDTYKLYVSSQYKIYAQSLRSAFDGMSALKSIVFDNFDTSGTTTMYRTFYGLGNLVTLDVSGFNTSKVASMAWMFSGCNNLSILDVSRFDTSAVNNNNYSLNAMFSGCSSLTELDVSGFDTSNAVNITEMFKYCSSLTSLDVSHFVFSRANNLSSMFSGCSSLTSLNMESWNTATIRNMQSTFSGCSSLISLDLSSFDTSIVQDMSNMFSNCSSLISLDLSSFDTSSVQDMSNMFRNCSNLEGIYVSNLWNANAVTSSTYMFGGCSSLPNYNSSVTDKTNAYYGTGGYLTYKAYNGS